MTTFRDEFPALWQFLGAYLHQDWQDEYTSTQDAFRDFLSGEPSSAARVEAELATVLNSGHGEEGLEKFVLEGGSFYLPSRHGIPTATWLTGLLDMCAAAEG